MSFPTLTTDRLILRLPEPRDCEAFASYAMSQRTRFVGGAKTLAQAIEKFAAMIGQWSLRGYGRFVITSRTGDGTLALGHAGPLHFDPSAPVELTWSLWHAEAEGQGIASEAAQAVHHWMQRDPRFETAVTSIHRDNIASAAIARKLGGRPTGRPATNLADAGIWQFALTPVAAE